MIFPNLRNSLLVSRSNVVQRQSLPTQIEQRRQNSTLILVGIGLAAIGLAGRYILRYQKEFTQTLKKGIDQLPGDPFGKYYHGGFDAKMTKREASLVLGISPNADVKKVKDAHKRIMIANHPDRGGSPYLAAKINEAKDLLDGQGSAKWQQK